jgi:hypothetical protein
MKNPSLKQFVIDLSINNINCKKDINALGLLRDELKMRPHLQCSDFSLNNKGDYCDISLRVIFWGVDEKSTGRQVAEELSEISCAILSHINGVNVKVLGSEARQ